MSTAVKTIDDISPKWSKVFDLISKGKIEKAKELRNKHNLDIGEPDRCIIGEAWKFKGGDYNNCDTCSQFCGYYGFMEVSYKVIEEGINWRENHIVKDFEKHWNEEHEQNV